MWPLWHPPPQSPKAPGPLEGPVPVAMRTGMLGEPRVVLLVALV